MGRLINDITGLKFGRLTAISIQKKATPAIYGCAGVIAVIMLNMYQRF